MHQRRSVSAVGEEPRASCLVTARSALKLRTLAFLKIVLILEGLFYGIEVRRVGRQEYKLATTPLDQLPNPSHLVYLQIVHTTI